MAQPRIIAELDSGEYCVEGTFIATGHVALRAVCDSYGGVGTSPYNFQPNNEIIHEPFSLKKILF
jgi:hypothetical protein